MERPTFHLTLLHPKYWLTWSGMGLWYALVQLLPHRLQVYLGRGLGGLLLYVAKSRVHTAAVNIDLCYPDLEKNTKQALIKRNLQETGVAFFESGAAWFWPNWRFRNKFDIIGQEHIERAHAQGKGVLFLGVHFTTIEIGASIVNLAFPISGFYRPHKNAVYEYLMAWGRVRRNPYSTVIPNGDVRGIVKALRAGKVINYAPDQDYGRRRSTFAPFFNISTATVKAPSQLASAGRAEVIPWVTKRDPKTHHYTVEILSPITDQLGRGEEEDALSINRFVEAQINRNKEQYLWVHRRFKTRPEGEASVY